MRTIDSLDQLDIGPEYQDAAALLSIASCLGWSEERLFTAVKALSEAKHITDLRDEKFS